MKRYLGLGVLAAVLALGGLHAWSYAPFLSDDALISLRYAERLITGHGLTWTDGERVEGYSDFAWVLLTAFFGLFGFELISVARVLGLIGAALAIVVTSLRPERPVSLSVPRALTGGVLLALTAPLAVWSIGALEHGFMAGVLILALHLLTLSLRERGEGRGEGPNLPLSLTLILLVWLRADAALLIAAMLLGALLAAPSLARLRAVILIGLVPLTALLAQHLFRRAYYGAWVPNTALVKVGFSVARVELGWQHVRGWLPFGGMLLVALAFALAAQKKTDRRWLIPLTTSVVWTGYLILVGGDIFPAWRQLLFAIVPLALIIADGAEAWWARTQRYAPRTSTLLRVGLVVTFTLLAAEYRRAQDLDPQNRRGHEERWEFAGFSLGPFLREAWGDRRPLLAVDAAGALPYFSKLPSLDLLGLNDRYIATHPPKQEGLVSTGHELGDGAYVWSRKPDILAMCGAAGARQPCFLGGKQLFAQPGFFEQYQLLRYHSTIWSDLRGDLWVRREGGVLSVERTAERLTVPGWLLAQNAGVVELHDGRPQALVTPAEPAHLERLRVPAGRWRVSRDVGFRCEGRSLAGRGDVLEVTSDAHVDLLVGADAPTWISEVVLERTDAPAQLTCDPRAVAGPLIIDADQLRGEVVPGGYFLQPHGVEVPREGVRIRLPAGHATRLEISVDGNDQYQVQLLAGVEVLGETRLPDQPRNGLAVQTLEVPEAVTELSVRMTGGDGRGSIGHLH